MASLGDSQAGTDTVPLPGDGGSYGSYDDPEYGTEADQETQLEDPLPLADASESLKTEARTPKVADAWAASTKINTFRAKSSSTADAWAAPRTPIHVVPDPASPDAIDPLSMAPIIPPPPVTDPLVPKVEAVPGGGSVQVPIPEVITPELEGSSQTLTLAAFREKVFAVQKAQEAKRFRDAIGIGSDSPKAGSTTEAKTGEGSPVAIPDEKGALSTTIANALADSGAPKAEPVAEENPGSPDSPKTMAAYQVFRWNLMETLASAERAYWRLHFAERQFEEVEKSVGTLAGINDKARIGVLRKTREPKDIVMTERLRGHRKIAVAEADAMRTAAMSEVASFFSSPEGGSLVAHVPILTEPPVGSELPSDATALVESARLTHPLYIAERMRVEDPENPDSPAAKAEVDTMNARLQQRVQGALERLRDAKDAIAKSRTEAETFAAGLDENLRNFGGGTISLDGITAFEKSLLSARQASIKALWDYQNALLDLELEVGDFLQTRGQEVPLGELLSQ